MSGSVVPAWWSRVPGLVWAALLTALIIGGVRLYSGGLRPIYVIGAGAVHRLDEGAAPAGERFWLDTRDHEAVARTIARLNEGLAEFPHIVVVSFDVRSPDDWDAVETALDGAENVPVVAILVAASPPAGLCAGELRICVADDRLEVELTEAVREARRRYTELRRRSPFPM